MTDTSTETLERLERERSAGKWEKIGNIGRGLHSVVAPDGEAELGTWFVAGVQWEADAELIAAAPALLAEVLALRKAGQQAQRALADLLSPEAAQQTTVLSSFAALTAAEAGLRAALNGGNQE